MAMEVEVNMKIPTLTVRSATEPDKRIDNSPVRFTKLVQVPAIPKPGTTLQLSTIHGDPFECQVTRADWHEERALFIVSCKYAKRSISADEYNALVNDPEWKMKPLL
jgi:hypothetical protein